MTQRLPVVGSDGGTWGGILNGYLSVSLNSDGTINTTSLASAGAEMTTNKGVANGYAGLSASAIVPSAQLGSGTASSSNYLRGDGTWAVPSGLVSSVAGKTGTVTLATTDLTDTSITSPTTSQVLAYNSSTSKWVNSSAPIPKRVTTLTLSGSTYTPACNTTDIAIISAPTAAFTIAAPTGSASDGQSLIFRIKSGATTYAPSWNASYIATSVVPPTALVASKTVTVGFVYDAASAAWICLAAETTGY